MTLTRLSRLMEADTGAQRGPIEVRMFQNRTFVKLVLTCEQDLSLEGRRNHFWHA